MKERSERTKRRGEMSGTKKEKEGRLDVWGEVMFDIVSGFFERRIERSGRIRYKRPKKRDNQGQRDQ